MCMHSTLTNNLHGVVAISTECLVLSTAKAIMIKSVHLVALCAKCDSREPVNL